MHPLIADGGELTVLRSLAAYAYGRWNVDWPENVPDDKKFQLPDDREVGYVSALKDAPGRMGRHFVRADVSVEAAEYSKDGQVLPGTGYSDVEFTLDSALERTDGDVFFEFEFTREHLGGLVPYVDFNVGDVVPVQIFGRRISSPVVSIEAVTDLGAVVDWRVRVGGTLLQDSQARELSLLEFRRDLEAERRERRESVREVSRSASSARADAAAAKRAVEDAEGSIRRGVKSVEEMIESGRESWGKAAEDYAKASAEVEASLSKLAQAEELLDKSDLTLEENRDLARQVKQAHSQIGELQAQMRAENVLVRQLANAAGAAAGQAVSHSAQAVVYVEQAEDLRKQIAGLVEEARGHISAGESAVSSARSELKKAQDLVKEAKQYAEDVDRVLEEIRPLEQSAKTALGEAGTTLTALQGEVEKAGEAVSQIDQMQTDILAKHTEIMGEHQVWLARHDEALDLLNKAVKAAAAGAGYAASGAMWAAQAAQEALNAAAANARSIELLDEITRLHGQSIKELEEADKKFDESIQLLKAAKLEQAKINKDQDKLNEDLKFTQGLIQEQVDNNDRALRYTNAAVRAVGGATMNAAMAAQHAADVARNAADVGKQALDVAEAQEAAVTSMRKANAARDETLKINEFYGSGAARMQMHVMDWNWKRRTQTFIHAGSKTETFGGLLKVWPIDGQKKLGWQALGNWWGRVVMIVQSNDGYGNNQQVTIDSWGVGPGFRSDTVERGKLLHAITATAIFVEVWLPDNPVFLLPVDTKTGCFTPTTLYDSEALKPFKFLADGRVEIKMPMANGAEVTPRVEISGATLKPKKTRIPGTELDVWPPYVVVEPL